MSEIVKKKTFLNCMKMKEFGPGGGVPGAPLDPPLCSMPENVQNLRGLKCWMIQKCVLICILNVFNLPLEPISGRRPDGDHIGTEIQI